MPEDAINDRNARMISREAAKQSEADRNARISVALLVSPKCAQKFLNVGVQYVAIIDLPPEKAEKISREVMAAVLESGNEATLVAGYISDSLRVTATQTFCDIVADGIIEQARGALGLARLGRVKHPEEDRLRKKLAARSHDELVEIALDLILKKERDALTMLKAIAQRHDIGARARSAMENLATNVERCSRQQSQQNSQQHTF